MDCVARRTRGQEAQSPKPHHRRGGGDGDGEHNRTISGIEGEARAGLRPRLVPDAFGSSSPAKLRPDTVIVLDDDDEVECKSGVVSRIASVATRTRSRWSSEVGEINESEGRDGRQQARRGSEASNEESVNQGLADVEEEHRHCGGRESESRDARIRCFRESESRDARIRCGRESESHGAPPGFARRRTRAQLGKQNHVSYTNYFNVEEVSDDSECDDVDDEDEDGDDEISQETEVDNTEVGEVVSVKKRWFSGIEVLVSSSKENAGEGALGNRSVGVAQRTRSHFHSEPIKKKKKKLGTIGNPYVFDVDESQSDSDSSHLFSGEDEEGVSSSNFDKMDFNGGEKESVQEELSERKSNKRKRIQAPKAHSLFKLLVDTIMNDKLPEGLVPARDESPLQDGVPSCRNPLIFSFEDEDPKPVEKTEEDKAMDELWADFDFCLESNSIGTYRANEGQVEEVNVAEVEPKPSTLCSKGEHQLIFNEQVGYICKICSIVVKEIKDILPSWVTRCGQASARKKYFHEERPYILDEVSTMTKENAGQGSYAHLEGSVWDLIPGVYRSLYQHQRDAFEFIWENLAGGIRLDLLKARAKSEQFGGCVISHAPGTGKTRLAIVFIQSYMKAFPECRPVIIAPCGMLLTWEKEFKKWGVKLPIHILNVAEYSGREDAAICELVQKEPRNRKWTRLVKLYSWAKGNGILGLSYGLFKRLTDERTRNDSRSADVSKILFEKPGLLVLDEGHTPRNDRTLIWKALEKVKTEQRIILSGTPFQNNFAELYNTLRLVKHKYAEKISPKTLKLCQRRAEFLLDNVPNKRKGKLTSQTNSTNDDSLEELRLLMKPFVHVYNGQILEHLPGMRECLIILEPLPLQKSVLEKIDDVRSAAYFDNEYKVSLASIHPSLLASVALSEKEKSLIDEHLFEKLRLNPNEGVKTKFIMEMVRLSEALKEKVVVFSQYLQPLSMIKDHLIKQFNWTEGKEVLKMEGKIPSKHRQSSIDVFNDLSSNARVLLASTRACCEGICLTGASRVVLLDIVWNPSVERQAISRAYRIGQEKVVHIYHLITSGTREGDKSEKQAKKKHLSKLVFSPELNLRNVENQESRNKEDHLRKLVSEDKILGEMTANDKLKGMFIKIYYRQESDIDSTPS